MASNTANSTVSASPFSSVQYSSAIESSSSTLFSSDKYKIPSEPKPLSFDSDEESFVVLGKSLIPEDELASDEIDHPIGTSVVEEAKQLINRELQAIDQCLQNQKSSDNANSEISSSNLITNSPGSAKLGQNSDLPEMPHVSKGFDTTNTISIATFSNDLSSVEVQNKISLIIEENIHLKDTILQNNMSMKSQYERIVLWQDDVQKVHQQHKEKILEAKEIIEKLKKENANLTHNQDRFKQIIDMQNDELTILKTELKNKTGNTSEVLAQNHRNLQQIVDEQNNELISLKNQLQDKEKEVETKLKETTESLQQIIEKQIEEINSLKNQLQETQKQADEKLSESTDNLKKVVESQQQELSALKIVLKDKERAMDEKLTQSTDNNLKEFQLDVANKKIKEMESLFQNLTLENSLLKNEKQQLQEDNSVIEKQEKKLQETLQHLKEVGNELETLKITSAETDRAKTKAIEDLRLQLTILTQHHENLPSPEEVMNIKTQLANTQIMLTQVEQSRTTAYSQINCLNQEIHELNCKIGELQKQGNSDIKDEVFALQTQLEVYKTDFEQERKAKEAIKEENEKLVGDLQNLHRRNQQLQEEVEIIRENRDFHVYPSTRPSRASNSTPSAPQSDSPPLTRHACPICQIRFRSLRLLEQHVDLCIQHRA